MTNPLADRIAVARVVSYCDTLREHELVTLTDGATAYTYGGLTDAGHASRVNGLLAIACNQPHCNDCDDPCHGVTVIDYGVTETWTSDPDAIALLRAHGTPIEGDQ